MWPPLYTLRKSQRAKYIRLNVSRHKGLEIVVPQHQQRYDILALLNKHRRWLEQRYLYWQPIAEPLPQHIELLALEKCWSIGYQAVAQPVQLLTQQQALVLMGNGDHAALLKHWLRQQAKQYLPSLLSQLSQATGLTYQRLTIRLQTTRWGSCSKNGHISLNAKLLFLPEILVKHVIIHELCHTVHFNHSAHFWQLVAQFDQDYQQSRIALRKANHYIPAWVER